MGRRRKYNQTASTSQSESSVSETSVNANTHDQKNSCKKVTKKPKTVSLVTSTPVSVRESLSKFAFQPNNEDQTETMGDNNAGQQMDKSSDEVFSLDSPKSARVTNEDLMQKLCANGTQLAKLSNTVEELRSEILTLQIENDRLKKEVDDAKKREEETKRKLAEVRFVADLADRRSEELSAYIRRNNIRIFGVDETTEGGREETADMCEKKVLALFNEQLKVKVDSGDIEAVHRVGTRRTTLPGGSPQQRRAPRGIIVRFISRRVRDSVLFSRRGLRGTRTVIVEDLTPRAYALLCTVRSDTTVCSQAWTKNGKVMMKILSGKVVGVDCVAELDKYRHAIATHGDRDVSSAVLSTTPASPLATTRM